MGDNLLSAQTRPNIAKNKQVKKTLVVILLIISNSLKSQVQTGPTGNIGIGTSNPSTLLNIVGHHNSTRLRMTFPASENFSGTGEVNLQAWVSEPGSTWDGAGIGVNVDNDAGANGFGRINTNLGQSFIRFLSNGGEMQFNTTSNNGTIYGSTLHLKNGNVGIGTPNPTAKLAIQSAGPADGNFLILNDEATINRTGVRLRFQSSGVAHWNMGIPADVDAFTINGWGGSSQLEFFRINSYGNVGIGTTEPGNFKLAVNGSAIFTKVQVKAAGTPWPDYVFHSNYKLRPLSSLESYITQNKHLPDVPRAEEVEKNGLDLGKTQALLLRKIEELTLYLIEQSKQNKKLEIKNRLLQKRVEHLERRKVNEQK